MSIEDDYQIAKKELRYAAMKRHLEQGTFPARDENAVKPYCSFCKLGTNQVQRMIQGFGAAICNHCIDSLHHEIHKGDE